MHDQPGVIEAGDEKEEPRAMTRTISFSIVKPPATAEDDNTDDVTEEDEVKKGASRSLFSSDKSASSESLDIVEQDSSPEKKGRLPTLVEISPVDGVVPVTTDDPLGALSSHNTPVNSPARDKTASNGDLLHQRSMSMSDVLGEPFSTPVSTKNNMHRSEIIFIH